MRRNYDLDALEVMRQRLEEQTSKIKERIKENEYISPKTATAILGGAALAASMGLAGAASVGLGVITTTAGSVGTAAAMTALSGIAVGMAATVKKIDTEREIVREGYQGYISKAAVFKKDLDTTYEKIKEQHFSNVAPASSADFVEYKQQLQSSLEAVQREKLEVQQQQQLEAQQRNSQGPRQSSRETLSFG